MQMSSPSNKPILLHLISHNLSPWFWSNSLFIPDIPKLYMHDRDNMPPRLFAQLASDPVVMDTSIGIMSNILGMHFIPSIFLSLLQFGIFRSNRAWWIASKSIGFFYTATRWSIFDLLTLFSFHVQGPASPVCHSSTFGMRRLLWFSSVRWAALVKPCYPFINSALSV